MFAKRIIATAGVAALATAGLAGAAGAQTVEMIVPFSAGGGTDTVARAFEPGFSQALGSTVVIRNVAGASGTIGASTAAQADADGRTIGYLPIGPVAIQPFLRDVGYDMDSWRYICQTTDNPVFLLVSNNAEAESFEDLVTAGRDGRLVYGSSGPGTIPHLAMAALVSETGMNGVHLPFEGTGPAMNALAGGEIQAFADTPSVLESHDVRALAVFAPERLDAYPDIPTLGELGHDLSFSVWQGVFAPAGLSDADAERFSSACREALNSDQFKDLAAKINTTIRYRDAGAFETFVRENAAMNERILRDAGLTQ